GRRRTDEVRSTVANGRHPLVVSGGVGSSLGRTDSLSRAAQKSWFVWRWVRAGRGSPDSFWSKVYCCARQRRPRNLHGDDKTGSNYDADSDNPPRINPYTILSHPPALKFEAFQAVAALPGQSKI